MLNKSQDNGHNSLMGCSLLNSTFPFSSLPVLLFSLFGLCLILWTAVSNYLFFFFLFVLFLFLRKAEVKFASSPRWKITLLRSSPQFCIGYQLLLFTTTGYRGAENYAWSEKCVQMCVCVQGNSLHICIIIPSKKLIWLSSSPKMVFPPKSLFFFMSAFMALSPDH